MQEKNGKQKKMENGKQRKENGNIRANMECIIKIMTYNYWCLFLKYYNNMYLK